MKGLIDFDWMIDIMSDSCPEDRKKGKKKLRCGTAKKITVIR